MSHKHCFTHRLKDGFVRFVVDPVPQWVIHCIIFSLPCTYVLNFKKKPSTSNKYNKMTIDTHSHYADQRCIWNVLVSLTLKSPVPGKYSPYLWKDTVMTRSVV